MLSLKLAARNIRKDMKSFGPFLIACLTMFVMLFVAASIAFSPSVAKLPFAGAVVGQLMILALVVLAIFGAMILIYSYRFLQLQRSREFGLYDILGFGKEKIALVSFYELLMIYLITLVFGSVIGIAFSKFSFLIFVNIIGGKTFNLVINPVSYLVVAAIFLVFFLLLLIIGCFIIWKSSSLDLLREASKGEKEPKSNIIFALLGIVLLAVGYYMAVSVENPVKALSQFFIAVILVIFGTYFFYVSFTVWYLKRKKKRASYYQPNNFITTSSMLYRMKANAVGLANITILLSMAIVTMVVTVGIFFGTERSLAKQYPMEGQAVAYNMSKEALANKIDSVSNEKQIPIEDLKVIETQSNLIVGTQTKDKTLAVEKWKANANQINFSIVSRDDLVKLGNSVPELTNQQLLVYTISGKEAAFNQLDWYGKNYQVNRLKMLKNYPLQSTFMDTILIVSNDDKTLKEMSQAYNEIIDGSKLLQTIALFEIAPTKADTFGQALTKNTSDLSMYSRTEVLKSAKSVIAGFVFIGFILGICFILGAALIIYYKQLSEGSQDKRSFKILQEVGLSKTEVQKTIKSQVRMLFFLPIVVSIIHFFFAYIMISKIIEAFGITDTVLVAWVSVGTILIIAILYYLIYKLTSRVYYKIVER